jgi:hypothetical protein
MSGVRKRRSETALASVSVERAGHLRRLDPLLERADPPTFAPRTRDGTASCSPSRSASSWSTRSSRASMRRSCPASEGGAESCARLPRLSRTTRPRIATRQIGPPLGLPVLAMIEPPLPPSRSIRPPAKAVLLRARGGPQDTTADARAGSRAIDRLPREAGVSAPTPLTVASDDEQKRRQKARPDMDPAIAVDADQGPLTAAPRPRSSTRAVGTAPGRRSTAPTAASPSPASRTHARPRPRLPLLANPRSRKAIRPIGRIRVAAAVHCDLCRHGRAGNPASF